MSNVFPVLHCHCFYFENAWKWHLNLYTSWCDFSFVLFQNAAITSQELISRKIKEYNTMMRYTALDIAPWGSTTVLQPLYQPFWIVCQSNLICLCCVIFFFTFCFCKTWFGAVHPVAGLSLRLKHPVSPSASSKPSWAVKQRARAIVLIHPKQRSGGHRKVKALVENTEPFQFVLLHAISELSWLLYMCVCVCVPCQMTPVLRETELRGNEAFQGSWGSPLRRSLLQGSHLGCDWMTVHLHRPTGWGWTSVCVWRQCSNYVCVNTDSCI